MTENNTQAAECLSHLTAELGTISDELKLLSQIANAYHELYKFGWQDAVYCPKDGSVFLAIEAGSTGIHECTYDGKWPDGKWWIHEEFDMYPSKPILWKPKP
jgi:hypothetical protein